MQPGRSGTRSGSRRPGPRTAAGWCSSRARLGSCLPHPVDEDALMLGHAGVVPRSSEGGAFPSSERGRASHDHWSVHRRPRPLRGAHPGCRRHGFPGSHGPPEQEVNEEWLIGPYRAAGGGWKRFLKSVSLCGSCSPNPWPLTRRNRQRAQRHCLRLRLGPARADQTNPTARGRPPPAGHHQTNVWSAPVVQDDSAGLNVGANVSGLCG